MQTLFADRVRQAPRAWAYCDAMPRSEAGKLLKRELREPHWIATGRAI